MDTRELWKPGSLLLAGMLLAACASTPEPAPAGSAARTLASEEVDGLLLGMGLGMAAAAEINGYPGPHHVLDLKEDLELTPDQRFATSRLVGLVRGQARGIGQRIIRAEQRLDEAMSAGDVTSGEVRGLVQGIAALRAQLRFVHLDAHLAQKKILTPEQVQRYYELRGRDVVVPAPHQPASPTEPLVLPAKPQPDSAPEAVAPATPPAPVTPAPGAAPVPLPATPGETVDPLPADATAEPEPVEAPVDAAPPLTPGMQDAMEDAEPEPAPPAISEPAQADGPPMHESEPPLLPGEQDVPDDPGPAPTVVEERPPAPAPTNGETVRPLTPGMQDAMEDAEPAMPVVDDASNEAAGNGPAEAPPLPDPPAEPMQPLEEPGAPNPTRPRALSPGAQDAMELARPADASTGDEVIYIAPLEDTTLEELPPVEGEEPVTIELDN